jgi:2-keto-4-pentenoate hydratase/2-oxohepta-3-ene-1,7-dioic acid hydratase in catechol pathway
MKIIRYQDTEGRIHHACKQADGSILRIEGDIFGHFSVTNEEAQLARLLAPIAPTQILCIGLNYRRHAVESSAPIPAWPVLFVKGINTVQHPGEPIQIPTHLKSTEVDYECELAVIIGKPCKNASRANALDYVLGYTCCNDVSARDWQLRMGGGQWCRGKFFDTFCPLGPALVTTEDIPDPNQLTIKTHLNRETVQAWNTNDMIFPVAELIEFLSGSTTLPAGTIILTGTPHGVGLAQKPPRWLRAGDEVTIEIERIGTLTNPVAYEPSA